RQGRRHSCPKHETDLRSYFDGTRGARIAAPGLSRISDPFSSVEELLRSATPRIDPATLLERPCRRHRQSAGIFSVRNGSGKKSASRRLQLAAEGSGVIGLALRCWRRQANAIEFRQPTAAMTR